MKIIVLVAALVLIKGKWLGPEVSHSDSNVCPPIHLYFLDSCLVYTTSDNCENAHHIILEQKVTSSNVIFFVQQNLNILHFLQFKTLYLSNANIVHCSYLPRHRNTAKNNKAGQSYNINIILLCQQI